MSDPFIDNFESYLKTGKVEPCCHLILQATQLPGASAQSVASAVIESLERLLDAFVIAPVLQFCGEIETGLPPEIAEPIQKRVGGRVAVIRDWSKRIDLIGRERRARELRATVRSGEIDEAVQVVLRILGPTGIEKPTPTVLEYIGMLLGSIDHGQRHAETLIARLKKGGQGWQLAEQHAEVIDRARHARTGAGGSEFREAEFVRERNNMAVEMKGWLPGPRVTGAPDEEQIVRFYHAIHAVTASVFLNNDPKRWIDVTPLLVEFCPRELSAAGRRAGVEERAFMTITPTARRVVFEAFGRLGRSEKVVRSYLDFARMVSEERLKRSVLEVMGTLRARPFLEYLRESHDDASTASLRSAALVAASNFADGAAAEFLLQALTRAISKGSRKGVLAEGPLRREAVDALFGLGRIARSPRMDPGGRNAILKQAITAVPDGDLRLKQELAYQFFVTPSEGWDPTLRDWAAQVLTRSLWLGDLTPEFAEGDDRQRNILGERNRAVQALGVLGKDAIPTILKTCEDSKLRYGAAYIALAEVLGRLGSPQSLDLLERLLATAMLQDDSGKTKYQVETYYDASEGVRKEIEPDQILSALLFAIEKIGGERADQILVHAYTQIFGPGTAKPGQESNEVLERVRARLAREDRWNEMVEKAGERRAEAPGDKKDAAENRRAAAAALKELQTRGLFRGKRREKKVVAIQTLASLRNLEAIPLIVEQLSNSDTMIRAAAETALGEYVWAATNKSVSRALIYALLDALRSRDDKIRGVAHDLLKRLGPEREPLHSQLVAINQTESDALLRAEASRLLRGEAEEEEEFEPDVSIEIQMGSESLASAPDRPEPKSEKRKDGLGVDEKMRLKREYLEARRAWIRDGKKGSPPQPPKGI